MTALLLTACVPFATAGARRTENRDIDDASEVVLRTSGDIVVKLGDAPALKATGGGNVLDRLVTDVEDGRLDIDLRRTPIFIGPHELKVEVTVTALSSLIIAGSGDARADFGNSRDVNLEIRGSGNISTKPLTAHQVHATISGSGSIDTTGETDALVVRVSGSGNVDAAGMTATDAKVVLSGSGDVRINAQSSLDVTLSGSGSVRYSGRPTVRSNVSGSGEVAPS